MADRRDFEECVLHRVGVCRTPHGVRAHSTRRAIHDSLVRRCAQAGFHLVEHGTMVPFSPWMCATCGRRDDLVAGSTAFCRACLEAAPREDDDDVYQDTGGGD